MQKDNEQKTIGKRIEIAREYRNMSRTELGRALGFTPKSAYRRVLSYEKGERIPKERILQRIAKTLKIDTDWFSLPDEVQIDNIFCFEHGANAERKERIKTRITVEKKIYHNLYRLTDDELHKVIDMIQAKGKEESYARRSRTENNSFIS